MTYFDEHGKYWGNSDVPYSADLAKDGEEGTRERLSRRSVKIFADGEFHFTTLYYGALCFIQVLTRILKCV
jgi:hypothetical protein